jgi:hypothetical protein
MTSNCLQGMQRSTNCDAGKAATCQGLLHRQPLKSLLERQRDYKMSTLNQATSCKTPCFDEHARSPPPSPQNNTNTYAHYQQPPPPTAPVQRHQSQPTEPQAVALPWLPLHGCGCLTIVLQISTPQLELLHTTAAGSATRCFDCCGLSTVLIMLQHLSSLLLLLSIWDGCCCWALSCCPSVPCSRAPSNPDLVHPSSSPAA